ncbi:hypothetical protein HK096_001389, partial [Nowakowskiella sp. JEL0078]
KLDAALALSSDTCLSPKVSLSLVSVFVAASSASLHNGWLSASASSLLILCCRLAQRAAVCFWLCICSPLISPAASSRTTSGRTSRICAAFCRWTLALLTGLCALLPAPLILSRSQWPSPH